MQHESGSSTHRPSAFAASPPARPSNVRRRSSRAPLLISTSLANDSSTFGGRFRDEQEAAQARGDPAIWASAIDLDLALSPIASKKRKSLIFAPPVDAQLARGGAGSPEQRPRERSETVTEEPESYEQAEREAPNEWENPEGQEDDGSSVPTDPMDEPYDDESDDESLSDGQRPSEGPKSAVSRINRWLDRTKRDVIKCVIAYFLAELWTFVPFLSDLVGAPLDVDGPVKNAHVIATVAVYFNSAKTRGSMIEADLFMLIGTLYAVTLCCGSMAMTVLLDHFGHEMLAHYLVLIFWLGLGFGFIAFAKVKVNKPTFTTATSLVSLITCVIITKEGAYHIGRFEADAIVQIIVIVIIGTSISNIVCFSLWPSSATSKFQSDLNKTLNSFSTLLDLLVKTFLMDETIVTRPAALKSAIDAHQSAFTTLRASLDHAAYEFFDLRMSHSRSSYGAVVKSMTKLAQGLTGMRSSVSLQWQIRKARSEGWHMIREEEILQAFLGQAGTSLEHLSWTCKRTLALLRISVEKGTSSDKPSRTSSDELKSLYQELDQALVLFKRVHNRAIKVLYQRPVSDAEQDPFADPNRKKEPLKKAESSDDRPNEDLFRIYFFCFGLEEWTRQLLVLVDTFIEVREEEEQLEARFEDKTVTQKLAVWIRAVMPARRRKRVSWRKRFMSLVRLFSINDNPFPRMESHAYTSHRTSETEVSAWTRFKRRVWAFGHHLREPTIRFAIKTGVGLALLAWPAFTSFRPVWLRWRGEWAMISYMVIMAPSMGATNFLAGGRILGTALGAAVAVLCVTLFPENAVLLPALGALFSIPCFYVIVTRPQYGPSSRFVLLTFNLTALYTYNLRLQGIDVVWIATHRFAAVAVGVLWGLIVSAYVWPYEGRKAMRKGLTEFFLNTAYLYQTLVASYSGPASIPATAKANMPGSRIDEHSQLLAQSRLAEEARRDLHSRNEQSEQMELYLQISLIRLSGLLESTRHEPRLKGPFPVASYREILQHAQNMLDLFVSIRATTMRESFMTMVRRDFVVPVNPERREMVGSVLLYLTFLAAAFELKAPMSPFLPPASQSRSRLVARLYSLPVVRNRIVRGGSESLLYLGYALVMKDVVVELDSLGALCQRLFGIVGSSENSTDTFEAMFREESA